MLLLLSSHWIHVLSCCCRIHLKARREACIGGRVSRLRRGRRSRKRSSNRSCGWRHNPGRPVGLLPLLLLIMLLLW